MFPEYHIYRFESEECNLHLWEQQPKHNAKQSNLAPTAGRDRRFYPKPHPVRSKPQSTPTGWGSVIDQGWTETGRSNLAWPGPVHYTWILQLVKQSGGKIYL